MKKQFQLNSAFVELVQQTALEAELRGTLPVEVWSQVLASNWLNLYLPEDLKGMGLELPEALLALEQLAELDGSLGWTITLCSGAHWFLGFLDKQLRSDLLIQDELCITGSGQAGGTAVPLDQGYWIAGEWPHASGADKAAYLTANFILNGKVQAFLLNAREASLFSNWATMGMKASASNGFRVSPQWIPAIRAFDIDPSKATHSSPIFQVPFELLAACTLAVNITGMVKRFIQLTGESGATSAFMASREHILKSCTILWEQIKKGDTIPEEEIAAFTVSARSLTQQGLALVLELYSKQSLMAAREDTELNRVWRNLHTAALHPLLRKLSG